MIFVVNIIVFFSYLYVVQLLEVLDLGSTAGVPGADDVRDLEGHAATRRVHCNYRFVRGGR